VIKLRIELRDCQRGFNIENLKRILDDRKEFEVRLEILKFIFESF
jgi:hypothetical protein